MRNLRQVWRRAMVAAAMVVLLATVSFETDAEDDAEADRPPSTAGEQRAEQARADDEREHRELVERNRVRAAQRQTSEPGVHPDERRLYELELEYKRLTAQIVEKTDRLQELGDRSGPNRDIERINKEEAELRQAIMDIRRDAGPVRAQILTTKRAIAARKRVERNEAGDRRDVNEDEIETRLSQLRREHRELEKRADAIHRKLDEADDLNEETTEAAERELRDIHARASAIRKQASAIEHPIQDRRRGEHHEDLQRRLEHLRAAAENLRAAGLDDEARQLMAHAEELMDQDRGHHEVDFEARAELLESEVIELREEVHDLREEIAEIREFLEDFVTKLEGELDGEKDDEFEIDDSEFESDDE